MIKKVFNRHFPKKNIKKTQNKTTFAVNLLKKYIYMYIKKYTKSASLLCGTQVREDVVRRIEWWCRRTPSCLHYLRRYYQG